MSAPVQRVSVAQFRNQMKCIWVQTQETSLTHANRASCLAGDAHSVGSRVLTTSYLKQGKGFGIQAAGMINTDPGATTIAVELGMTDNVGVTWANYVSTGNITPPASQTNLYWRFYGQMFRGEADPLDATKWLGIMDGMFEINQAGGYIRGYPLYATTGYAFTTASDGPWLVDMTWQCSQEDVNVFKVERAAIWLLD